jgi:beta-glucosidase
MLLRFPSALWAALFLLTISLRIEARERYQDPSAPLEARVDDLFNKLTPDERLSLLNGTAFTTRAIPRLGVPAMIMSDAGQGVRAAAKP